MSANPSHFQPKVSVHTDVPLINSDRRPVESITYLEATRFANAVSKLAKLSPCYDENGVRILEEGFDDCFGFRLPRETELRYAGLDGWRQTLLHLNDPFKSPMKKRKQHQWQRLTKIERRESLLYGPIDEIAWHYQNSDQQSHEVGQKQRSFFGVYDLVGNVGEWLHTDTNDRLNASSGGSWKDAIHKDKGWRFRTHKASAMSSIGLRLVRPTPTRVQYEPKSMAQRGKPIVH